MFALKIAVLLALAPSAPLDLESRTDARWGVFVRSGWYADLSDIGGFIGPSVEGWILGPEGRWFADDGPDGWLSVGLAYDHAQVRGGSGLSRVRGEADFLTAAGYATWHLNDSFALYGGLGFGAKFATRFDDEGDRHTTRFSSYVPLGASVTIDPFELLAEFGAIGRFDAFVRLGFGVAF